MGIFAFDNILRQGLGVVGDIIGTRFSVYRLGGKSGIPNAATSLVHPLNLVQANFPARVIEQVSMYGQEQERLFKLWYTSECDSRRLKIGDCLVETGPNLPPTPDGRAYIYAGQQPLLPTVFYRTEVFSQISRTGNSAGVEEPILGKVVFQGETKFEEQTLSLVNGFYTMGFGGISATIPIGLQPRQRPGSPQGFKYPTSTHHGAYVAFLPLMPGFTLQPNDYITDHNGNRYKVEVVTAFTSGLQGYQAICEAVFV